MIPHTESNLDWENIRRQAIKDEDDRERYTELSRKATSYSLGLINLGDNEYDKIQSEMKELERKHFKS